MYQQNKLYKDSFNVAVNDTENNSSKLFRVNYRRLGTVGYSSHPMAGHYVASKWSVRRLTQAAAMDKYFL
jgi:hypothetical protein